MLNRVIIYDHHPLMVEGLSRVMRDRGYVIANAISDPAQLIHSLVLDTPSLVVMDLQGLSELQLKQLQLNRRRAGACRLLIYASCDSSWHALQRLKVDLNGYLSKSLGPEMFRWVLDEVEKGRKLVLRDADIAAHSQPDRELITALTHRERQILHELGAGKSNKVIASELHLSNKTVSTYKRSIMQKMQTRNVCDVVDLARRNGF
jgi:two-component system response regulator EvgA